VAFSTYDAQRRARNACKILLTTHCTDHFGTPRARTFLDSPYALRPLPCRRWNRTGSHTDRHGTVFSVARVALPYDLVRSVRTGASSTRERATNFVRLRNSANHSVRTDRMASLESQASSKKPIQLFVCTTTHSSARSIGRPVDTYVGAYETCGNTAVRPTLGRSLAERDDRPTSSEARPPPRSPDLRGSRYPVRRFSPPGLTPTSSPYGRRGRRAMM
jgi:hypothetical protein